MATYNHKWGNSIAHLLEHHGLSLRAARAKTGGVVSHTTISDWCSGLLPKYDQLACNFLSHFPKDEAIKCLQAGGISIPDGWLYEHEMNVSIPGVALVILRPAHANLTEEEIEEVARAVRHTLKGKAS